MSLSQFIYPLFEEDKQRVPNRESLRGCCVRVIAEQPGLHEANENFKSWAETNLVKGYNDQHFIQMHMKDHPLVQGLIEIDVI